MRKNLARRVVMLEPNPSFVQVFLFILLEEKFRQLKFKTIDSPPYHPEKNHQKFNADNQKISSRNRNYPMECQMKESNGIQMCHYLIYHRCSPYRHLFLFQLIDWLLIACRVLSFCLATRAHCNRLRAVRSTCQFHPLLQYQCQQASVFRLYTHTNKSVQNRTL